MQCAPCVYSSALGVAGAIRPHTSTWNDTSRQCELNHRSNGQVQLDAFRRVISTA